MVTYTPEHKGGLVNCSNAILLAQEFLGKVCSWKEDIYTPSTNQWQSQNAVTAWNGRNEMKSCMLSKKSILYFHYNTFLHRDYP